MSLCTILTRISKWKLRRPISMKSWAKSSTFSQTRPALSLVISWSSRSFQPRQVHSTSQLMPKQESLRMVWDITRRLTWTKQVHRHLMKPTAALRRCSSILLYATLSSPISARTRWTLRAPMSLLWSRAQRVKVSHSKAKMVRVWSKSRGSAMERP